MISIEGTKTTYTGDGATKIFAYANTFLVKADLVVKRRVIATGIDTLFVLDTDYSITATNDDYSDGATITTLSATAIPATEQLVVETIVSALQSTDYPPKSPFPNQSTEDALDRLTLLVQQLERRIDECLRVSDTDAQPGRLANSVDRADKLFGFDSNGLPVFTVALPPATSNPLTAPEITSGAGLPGSAPGKVGDIYIDLTADIPYIAVDTLANTDFLNVRDLIFDTTPQLGGDLDGNSNAITGLTTVDTSGGYKIDGDLILNHDSANNGIFFGLNSGLVNAGINNVGIGEDSLRVNTSGTHNTAISNGALSSNLGGDFNFALGFNSLTANISGDGNTGIGYLTLSSNVSNSNNTGIGREVLKFSNGGSSNTGVGSLALEQQIAGDNNAAIGAKALQNCLSNNNVAIGDEALIAVSTGANNIGIGRRGGNAISTGSKNLVIAYDGDAQSGTASNQVNIGNVLWGSGCSGTGTTPAGQLSIGTNTPATDALFELNSTSKAFLAPRMTTAQRDAIGSPVVGMLIYNLTTISLQQYNGTAWSGDLIEFDRGEELHLVVTNKTGSTITKGSAVRINGYDSATDKPTITKSKADLIPNAAVLGIVNADILNNASGDVTISGRVSGLDTSTFSEGDPIFLSAATAGEFTATKPAGIPVQVGHVNKVNVTTGHIHVNVNFLPASIRGILSDSTDQTFTLNVSQAIEFNTNDVLEGITHSESVDNDELTMDNAGTYVLTVEPQYSRSSGGGTDVLNMYIQKDTGGGFINIPDSNIKVAVSAANVEAVTSLTQTLSFNAADKIRIMIQTEVSTLFLDAFAAFGSDPNDVPATPSVILNIHRIGD